MRILCVCDEGVSRSPTIAALLQYRGHETIAVGVNRVSSDTWRMLADWCELAIFTDPAQAESFPAIPAKATVWRIADEYPRPFNAELRRVVLEHAEQEGL